MSIVKSKKSSVPKQEKGDKSDTYQARKFKSVVEAQAFFKVAKNRLLDVSDWHRLSGIGSATFALMDNSGNKVRRLARQGDFIRIDIPGPGTDSGDGYDWVRLELIETKKDPSRDYEEISMRARPAKNPKDNAGATSHFFNDDANSTFIVARGENIVQAEVHGRNELPNIEQSTGADKLRNAVMAVGAMLGFSKFQWKKLVKGIVAKEE